MGAAIQDYHKYGKADTLIVRSSMFDDDEIPVKDLFREYNDMPELEQQALKEASGRILDEWMSFCRLAENGEGQRCHRHFFAFSRGDVRKGSGCPLCELLR